MLHLNTFYIAGSWVEPEVQRSLDLLNPQTERPVGRFALGGRSDVDQAVAAARRAFPAYASWSRQERLSLLDDLIQRYELRRGDIAEAISLEMGAPGALAEGLQFQMGLAQLKAARAALETYAFEQLQGSTLILHDPSGYAASSRPGTGL